MSARSIRRSERILDRDLYATAVLSGNRNFEGRINPDVKANYLASPPLVVAYAIAGTVRFDIEKDVLGIDRDGQPVTLKDLWPDDAEIDAIVAQSVRPEHFRRVYDPMFKLQPAGAAVRPLYDWRPSTIRRPPYWEGALAGSARCAACVRSRCCPTTSRPITCRRPTQSCSTARRVSTSRKWVCRRRTSTATRHTVAITSRRNVRRLPTRRS
jgi:aconitase A